MTDQPAVQPGYEIGRDDDGLTARERQVLAGLEKGQMHIDIGADLGISRQRVGEIVGQLKTKGRWPNS